MHTKMDSTGNLTVLASASFQSGTFARILLKHPNQGEELPLTNLGKITCKLPRVHAFSQDSDINGGTSMASPMVSRQAHVLSPPAPSFVQPRWDHKGRARVGL